MDTGLLILRAVLALILFTHATQKLYGWFGGNGLSKQAGIFSSLGLRPGKVMVAAAGATELTAAVLLILGLFTPVAALLAAATMGVAGLTMHLNSGSFWNIAGGGEYPYVLATLAVVLAFTGAGGFSIDAALFSDNSVLHSLIVAPAVGVGLAVVVLSALAAMPFAAIVRRNQARP